MSEKVFPAHIKLTETDPVVQTVRAHCRHTARCAGDALLSVELSALAFLAGLLHDMGKYKEEYRSYLKEQVFGTKGTAKGSVIHTFAAVRFLLERYHRPPEVDEDEHQWTVNLTAELLAFAVGAHHGLFNCVDEKQCSGFEHRLEGGKHYAECLSNYLDQCADLPELDKRFAEAVEELKAVTERLEALLPEEEDEEDEDNCAEREECFYLGLLARLLLSAVIEGDRRDTAEFMNGSVYPDWGEDRRSLWKKLLTRAEEKLAAFPSDTPIQRARQTISQLCREAAERPGGVFRLNVPTGSGKTLSSLRYALAHAAKWNKRRVIFTSPLLSILEQNTQVIRDYVQDDTLILEHHSNVVRTREDSEALDRQELLTENWNAPVIVTTLVQLLNTLFSGKTSCIRRFHALCDSVIVIDEVQTVPNRMLSLFNLALNFLSGVCRTTVVLCSATQPALERVPHPVRLRCAEIVPYSAELWQAFARTRLRELGRLRLEEIPAAALEVLEGSNSLLIVCNKKGEAEALFRALSGQPLRCFHLSAAMCMEHRRETLNELETSLERSRKGDGKTVCVSTQVIEAGVDISFERVIRLTAGMDSVVQSAGRCNRNGESTEPVPVYLLQCADETLKGLTEIQMGKDATAGLLRLYQQHPERYQNTLDSQSAIEQYYRLLYSGMSTGYQDCSVPHGQRKLTLLSLLSENSSYYDEDCPFAGQFQLNQAFKLAGSLFTVFDEDTVDVIVPHGAGEALISELGTIDPARQPQRLSALLEQAKPYTVSLYDHQRGKLEESGALFPLCGGAVLALQRGWYDEQTGLIAGKGEQNYLEV